jgi:putative ABC transport system permease protein
MNRRLPDARPLGEMMGSLRRTLLRLLTVFRHGPSERELAREVDAHLGELQREFERRGLPPDEARVAARRSFGGIEQVKELQRDVRSFRWLEDLRRDVAYGVRTLSRTRGFTVTATLTLALGISAVTVIYSVVRNVVLEPFPYSRSDRLVNVVLRDGSDRQLRGPYFPAAEFLDYQEQATAFEDVVGTSRDAMLWQSENGAERFDVAWMTANGFDFLGVKPLIGRVFDASDTAPGAPRVAVMCHRAWIRSFGADPGVIGRTLVLDGTSWTVIGVMPPRFEWNIADVWLPAAIDRSDDPRTPRGTRAFQAHLRPGVSPKEAEAQLNVIGARRAREHPNEYPPQYRFQVIKVVDWVIKDFRVVLYVLFGAVSLLLVIACCNVANMLLARATSREREMAIRAAIGASRGRIVRQLLVESALLAAGGLVAGALMAYGGIQALARLLPPGQGVPWETQIRLDRPVLVFAVMVAAASTFAFGLFPALQSVRRDIGAGANVAGRTTAGRRQTRMRGSLVIAQVALAMVLLLGAGLLMRTFVKLVGVDLGFDPKNVLVAGVALPPQRSTSADDQRSLYRQVADRSATVPGVVSVALASGFPPFGGASSALEIPGMAMPPSSQTLVVFGSERLLETLGIPIVKGRGLSTIDIDQSHRVAVVNETLARRYFGSDDPLARVIRLPRLTTLPRPITDPTFRVIGIMRDVATAGPRDIPAPEVLLPFSLRLPAGLALVVRTTADPLRAVDALRREIHVVDPQVVLANPNTLERAIQTTFYASPGFSLLMLGIFAATGAFLVALGIYGVLAYTVSQQTREIAIRMALGGESGHVVRMIVRFGLRLVAAGLVVGLAISFATNRLLGAQLWKTSPTDPVTFGVVILLITTIGVLACWVPARRAVRVQPMIALRHE